MNLIEYQWHGNSVWELGAAAALAALVLIALYFIKRAAVRRMAVRADGRPGDSGGLWTGVLRATWLWLFVPLALYLGAQALTLSARIEHRLELAVTFTLLAQAALWVNGFVALWFARKAELRRPEDGAAATTLGMLGFAARFVLWALVLLLALRQMGFDITALLAGLGIGGIAVALALQNILGDLFASLSIVLDKPFVVGDFIIVGDFLGTVEHIGLKTTRLRSLSGELIVFSNTDLLKSRIRNYKRMYERRVLFTLGVIYQTPVEKLERIPELLRAAIAARTRTRFDRAHFKEYGDSALIFEAVYYVLDPDYNIYMDIHHAVNLEVLRSFAREGIEFAYPTRTLYVNNATTLPA